MSKHRAQRNRTNVRDRLAKTEADLKRAREALVIAFVQGARWWEYEKTHFTMWQADQNKALAEARKKLAAGRLGVDVETRLAAGSEG
jgi:hypothetical protein